MNKLHECDYVHGDIRVCNIIFSESSTLIDFDLTDKVDECYPTGYNFYKSERHVNAKPGKQMKKIHARFALSLIMDRFEVPQSKEIIQDLRNEQIPLASIIKKLTP